MAEAIRLVDPDTADLTTLDVSNPDLYQHNLWPQYFARLRRESPVHYTPDSAFGPFWSVTRFADIIEVEKNHQIFSSEPTVILGDQPEDFQFVNFIQSDPPIHDEQRKVVQPVVAPRNLANLEGLIRQRAASILDQLPTGETINWVQEVSIELTTQMLATLFDFPFAERRKLTYWSDMAIATEEMTGSNAISEEDRRAVMMECYEYFCRLFDERRNKPEGGFDLLTMLANDPATEDMPKDTMQFLGNLMLLIIGGNDTTRNSISGGVVALNQYPAEYDKLRADAGLIRNMVSEIIRWQTPLTHMRRTATRDVEFHGASIKQGDKVVMWYISGNRDADAIDRADEFIIDRADARHHLSFGFGIHRCMGNRLAEMQLRVLWEEITQRFSNIELVGEPEKVRSNFINGFSNVPVILHPA